ncbi:MAG: TraB family protein [Nanoarchaeota archaeon]|nr:TraB family protein [Nanoarchaeota archaeon]MBU0962955.1 TraB family protein [Nanoarchaeota archaeon]
MQTYKNITIIGTSHIAIESVKEVESEIRKIKPDIVAIELDRSRFLALFSKKRKISFRDIRKIGVKGYLFNLIGHYAESKLGKMVGVIPGSEMKKAVEIAKEIGAKTALIDQDISITLKRLTKSLTFKEKLNFFVDLILSVFKREKIDFDLKKVPDKKIIEKLTKRFKKRYPSVYNVLVDERNKYMGKNLYKLMLDYNNLVAVVGAGHEEDLIKEIKIWESLEKRK